jgi:hypothetical protein
MTNATITPTTPTTPTATEKNPHTIATAITGWGLIAVFLGALWGAGHDPAHASWSALAVVAAIVCYVVNKTRKIAHNLRTRPTR